ncbi:MAG: hypothetical protein K2G46_01920, partial [Bacteroidales bacterium]|nr:hypothetical protein [Bacteroidales bacterium]
MRTDGVFNISESEVLFQTDVSQRLRNTGTVEIPIPNGKFLTKGTYYLTLEGRVRGQSNQPDKNTSFSAKALSAMFPCHTFQVVKNDLPIHDLTITPPKCSHQKGQIAFSYSAIRSENTGQSAYEVHEWIDGQWKPSTLFTLTRSSNMFQTFVTARADSVPQGEHRFAFRYYSDGQLKGHTAFDGSIPVVPAIECPVLTQNISGTIIESGRTRTTEDGYIFIPRNQIKNGKPPYNITYGTLNAQGQQPSISRPFPQDTLQVTPDGCLYL